MSPLMTNVECLSDDIKGHFSYLRRHGKASKIPRFKLQAEFAHKGWNTCSAEFKSRLGESECSIVASPTKYPDSGKKFKSDKNCSSKKPMLVEISNIESEFLQNKYKSSKLQIKRKLPQSFLDFEAKLKIKEPDKTTHLKKVTSEFLNPENIDKSFWNKKHYHTTIQPCESKTSLNSVSGPGKGSYYNKEAYLKDISVCKNVHDVVFKNLLHNEFQNKNLNCVASVKDKLNHGSPTVTKVPCDSYFLKNSEKEVITKVEKNNKVLNSESFSDLFKTSFYSEGKCHTSSELDDSHAIISDLSPIKESSSKKEANVNNLNESRKPFDVLKDIENELVSKNISPVFIREEISPVSFISPEVPPSSESIISFEDDRLKTVTKVPCDSLFLKNSEKEVLITKVEKNNKVLNSESFCDLFKTSLYSKGKCHTSSELDDSHAIISDLSPIKESSSKKEANINNLNESRKSLDVLKYIENELVNKKISPIFIEEEISPVSFISPEVPPSCESIISFENDRLKILNVSSPPKCHEIWHSKPFNLQDLHKSFQVQKHSEGSPSSDCATDSIANCSSPVKAKFRKVEVSLSTSIKFKDFSEAFGNSSENAQMHRKTSPVVFIQEESSPRDATSTKVLSMRVPAPFIADASLSATSNDNVPAEGKSVVLDSKAFKKTIQSSFLEKSASADKGSTWVQSLNCDHLSQSKESNSENDDLTRKKKLKNIVHGGFAEQMLKLQRRERSDKVIWNHKRNELKKKTSANFVTFTVVSVQCAGNIIVSKCSTTDIDKENLNVDNVEAPSSKNQTGATSCDFSTSNVLSKMFVVLFKKDAFSKLLLKVGDSFILYPPWQMLHVLSIPFPVIMCTYFVDPVHRVTETEKSESLEIQPFPVIYRSLQVKSCNCQESLCSKDLLNNSSDLYQKSVCVSARVQRIWETCIVDLKIQDHFKINDYLCFSVLLQTQDGIFLELKINSNFLSNAYQDFLLDGEGKCFRFCNIRITHRYNLKKHHKLRYVLDHLQKYSVPNKASLLSQTFCYQCVPISCTEAPPIIPNEHLPAFCDYDVKPLSFLIKDDSSGSRFSFIGKVLFQNKEACFISDESLLGSKKIKYCKLKFMFLHRILKQSIVGSVILLKDALNDAGCLFVDQFSSYEILSNIKTNKFLPLYESRLKKISFIISEHVLSTLNISAEVKHFVLVRGIITEVDESSAISWLECPLCFKENLLEDSNSVIFCETCSSVVPKPVLKLKMEVTVRSTDLHPSKMRIQLLSDTVKRILKIAEDDYHPQCNISDVLEKDTGVLCCYIRSIEVLNKLKVFYLTEINSCR